MRLLTRRPKPVKRCSGRRLEMAEQLCCWNCVHWPEPTMGEPGVPYRDADGVPIVDVTCQVCRTGWTVRVGP